MRGLLLLAPMFMLAAACSSQAGAATGDEGFASTTSKVTASCNLSRDQILASASADRQDAIQRGFAWLDANVPYSQSATNDGYRTDCSGFVSMCWGLQQPGFTTADFSSGDDGSSDLGSYDGLAPGDALVRRENGEGHVMMFLGWNDDAHSEACAIEEADTALDMQFGVHTVDSLQGQGFKAIRNNNFGDNVPSGTTTTSDPTQQTTGDDDDDSTGLVTDPGVTTDPSTITPVTPTAPVDPGTIVNTPSGPVYMPSTGLPGGRTYGACTSDAACDPDHVGLNLVCMGQTCVAVSQ